MPLKRFFGHWGLSMLLALVSGTMILHCSPAESDDSGLLAALLLPGGNGVNGPGSISGTPFFVISGSIGLKNGTPLANSQFSLSGSSALVRNQAESTIAATDASGNFEISLSPAGYTGSLETPSGATYDLGFSLNAPAADSAVASGGSQDVNVGLTSVLPVFSPLIVVRNAPTALLEGTSATAQVRLYKPALYIPPGTSEDGEEQPNVIYTVTISSSHPTVTINDQTSVDLTFTDEDLETAQPITFKASQDTNLTVERVSISATGSASNGEAIKKHEFKILVKDDDITHVDAFSPYSDIGRDSDILVDTVGNKVIMGTTLNDRPGALICNRDGSGCNHFDLSAGQGSNNARAMRLILDTANSKILVISSQGQLGNTIKLFRCNLNGSGCTSSNVSAGMTFDYANQPDVVIDTANAKLLIVTSASANSYRPTLIRCNLDGTSCTSVIISAGEGPSSGFSPSIALDTANSKILVATKNDARGGTVSIFRCNLDGSSCTHHSVSGSQGPNSGFSPSIAVDQTNGKVLVTAATEHRPPASGYKYRSALYRCNLNPVSSCAFIDISLGEPDGGPGELTVDGANNNLYVLSRNRGNYNRPTLLRCGLAGTACFNVDLVAGSTLGGNGQIGYQSIGYTPHLAIDSAMNRIVFSTYTGKELQGYFFSVPLDYTP